MQRFKNILKFIGLIFLTLSVNIFPMRLIATQETTPTYMQWLASLGYLLALVSSLFLFGKNIKTRMKRKNYPLPGKTLELLFSFILLLVW